MLGTASQSPDPGGQPASAWPGVSQGPSWLGQPSWASGPSPQIGPKPNEPRQNWPNFGPKIGLDPRQGPNLAQICTTKLAQFGAQICPKLGPRAAPCRQIGPKIVPNWAQNWPKLGPNLGPGRPQAALGQPNFAPNFAPNLAQTPAPGRPRPKILVKFCPALAAKFCGPRRQNFVRGRPRARARGPRPEAEDPVGVWSPPGGR